MGRKTRATAHLVYNDMNGEVRYMDEFCILAISLYCTSSSSVLTDINLMTCQCNALSVHMMFEVQLLLGKSAKFNGGDFSP